VDGHGFGSQSATRAFIRKLDSEKPALLHLHNLHGYYINIEILFDYIRHSGIPTLWTLHDCWSFTGHCSHFVRAGCGKWREQCERCPLTREYPANWGIDRSRHNYLRKKRAFTNLPNLRIAAPSRWLAGLVAQSYLSGAPLDVIPNGVDTGAFHPPEREMKHTRPLVLAVASQFDARKGYMDTLSVAQKLLPEADITLVGLTKKQIAALPSGIDGRAHIGDRSELVGLYQRADVLINTTYEDTYPTVNMEAIACGTPVVSYNTGGCAEQIAVGCGELVPVGDADGMAEAVRRVLARDRSIVRNDCQTHSLNNFDRNEAMNSYIKLYTSMVKQA
jgi:glycosyltransferase involved in cell wall biosynthesis